MDGDDLEDDCGFGAGKALGVFELWGVATRACTDVFLEWFACGYYFFW